jgi:hypothetical protein
MNIDILLKSVKIIKIFDKMGMLVDNNIQIGYFPNSYENGTPKNPSTTFLSFEINQDITESTEKILKDLGWECDWPYYTYKE